MVLTQQSKAVVLQRAKVEAVEVCMPSVDTAFLHGLTTQTDSLCDFPPTSAVQGLYQRVRQPKRFVRRHKLCSHTCVREGELPQQQLLRNSTTVTLVKEGRVQNGMRVQLWLWQLRPLASPCASQPARDRRAPTTGSTCYARFHHSSSRK